MLTTLRIENFTIVKQLELDFTSGMTVFTGETGAGKSIIIDALMLALGERADTSVIRSGTNHCDIIAVFQVEKDSDAMQWLLANDLAHDNGNIILRRLLYRGSRSKVYINGQPCLLQQSKELGDLLVHIHGQNQHQGLLQPTTHRIQLDNYAQHIELCTTVKQHYDTYQAAKQKLACLSQVEINTNLSLLKLDIAELIAANVQPDEMQTVQQEYKLLQHAQDYLQQAQQIYQILSADENFTVSANLRQVLQHLQHLPLDQPTIDNSLKLINEALIQCEEASKEMEKFCTQLQLNPQRLQDLSARMSVLHQLSRKYNISPQELPAQLLKLQGEAQILSNNQQQLHSLQQEYELSKQAYENIAAALTLSRQEYAPKLAAEITTYIQQLAMPHGRVEVTITPLEKPQAHGKDKVEYKVATNPDSAPDIMAKIISGGELSRISLAIHMITAKRSATPSLIFDEIDVGVGGATAALIGQLLRKLGAQMQIFCVTHQAQVASWAHNHFVVEKHSENNHTYSYCFALDNKDKINEIARMLGGFVITEQTKSSAKELLEQALEGAMKSVT